MFDVPRSFHKFPAIVVSYTSLKLLRLHMSREVVYRSTILRRNPVRPTSLKGLIPHLVKSLAITPAAIYERQRALVRVGLLRARPGRGPGSGVPADAKSVATLLISILATGSLSEVEDQTKAVASLKSANGRCKITGKRTFGAALAATLASDALR